MGFKSIALLSLGWAGLTNALSTGTFTWPSITQQCEIYNVTIYDGVPPWTLVLAPIGGQPIYWDITAPPRYDPTRSVNAPIPLQIPIGTSYTVFMQDSSGYFSGVNPTQIQIAGLGSNSDCFTDVIAHSQDFTFTVAGSTSMCEKDFEISWLDQVGTGPYNFTVLPLDSSSNPWEETLTGGGTTTGASEWAVNMTTGTRFTIMMNNGYGYGAGGIGGIYQVAEGSTNSCITSPMYATAAWPGGVLTSTILQAAQLPTSVITSRSARPTDGGYSLSGGEGGSSEAPTSSRPTAAPVTVTATTGSSGLSTGAIAGIAAAVGVLALAAIGVGIWFCMRKRRRHGSTPTQTTYAAPVDLNDDSGHGPRTAFEPKIEPYPSPPLGQVPEMGYAGSSQSFSHSNLSSPDPQNFVQYGMATAPSAQQYQQQNRGSMAYSDNQYSPIGSSGQERYSMSSGGGPQVNSYFPAVGQDQPGPGQAGPLPTKANIARHSYLPNAQPHGSTTGGLGPNSPGPGSVSGSSSSGRGLPMPPGMAQLSESGASDSKTNLQSQSPMQSQSPTQGHEPQEQEPVFNIHRDAEAEPVPQGGMIDLPPMYNDVPQRREG